MAAMTEPSPTILIPAAGASSRMRGADKLLEPVGGVPLIRRQAETALAAGCPVIVTLPPDRPARVAALAGLAVRQVIVPDAAQGLSASLAGGLARAEADRAVIVLLADLPEITAEDLHHLIACHRLRPGAILRATAEDGTPGHPVLFPVWARPELLQMTGDSGARDLLRRHADRVAPVALPGRRAVTDLDTPEDWAAWRAR
jgi:CTP:molybdopterin cytidylyltransferase MocA